MANALIDFSNELAQAAEASASSVLSVAEGGPRGVSATVWSPGVAIAVAHTLRGLDQVHLGLHGGKTVSAKIAGRDHASDLAVLKFDAEISSPKFADPATLKPGNVVLSIGRRPDASIRIAWGTVASVTGEWRTWGGSRIDLGLKLDLAPFPGFSGGPLVNAEGAVVGINMSGPRGRVITIPKGTVDRIAKLLQEKGRIPRGYLGVGLQPVQLAEQQTKAAGAESHQGLLVITLSPSGPADKAGLLIGDIIVAVNGAPTDRLGSLQTALDPEQVGKHVALRIVRGGEAREISVVVGEREE